jgi:ABC-2 type transport system permease protein
MTPWRLELLRLARTRRAVALVAMFVVLGFGGPVLVHYLPELVNSSKNASGLDLPKNALTLAPPKPVDGIKNFGSNVSSLGTLALVMVAAASLSIDANPVAAIFYRTRVQRPSGLLMPRFVAVMATSVLALAIGALGACYETSVLIGRLPLVPLVVGFLLEALWVLFVGTTVAFFSSVIRDVLGVAGAAVMLFLALALLENVPHVVSWLPTRLADSAADLVGHPAGQLWHAVVITGVSSVLFLWTAVNRLGEREVPR